MIRSAGTVAEAGSHAATEVLDAAFREDTYAAQDGRRLYFRDYGPAVGDRVPVLCLSGLTRNSRDFHRTASRLAAGRRVICPDYRGRGRSERDDDWRTYRPQNLMSDIGALITALGLDRLVVIGTSLGGLLGMALTVFRPTAVAGLVLNDVGPEFQGGGLARIRDYIGADRPKRTWAEAIDELQRLFPHVRVPEPEAEGWITMAEGTWRPGADGLLHFDFDTRLAKTLGADAAIPDLWPLFRATANRPTAVLRGEISDVLGAETVTRMQQTRPDLIAVTVPDVGHTPHLDEPESRDAIATVLAAVDAGHA